MPQNAPSRQQASSSRDPDHGPSSSKAGSPSKSGKQDVEKKKEKRRMVEWKYTTAPMNARDLARDDDFIRYIAPTLMETFS